MSLKVDETTPGAEDVRGVTAADGSPASSREVTQKRRGAPRGGTKTARCGRVRGAVSPRNQGRQVETTAKCRIRHA